MVVIMIGSHLEHFLTQIFDDWFESVVKIESKQMLPSDGSRAVSKRTRVAPRLLRSYDVTGELRRVIVGILPVINLGFTAKLEKLIYFTRMFYT